ncbi:unconventional myosin-IXa-like [Anopheles marshallii]|uniref:unconventional myosin-IXa-like n=1 Tax=Anopheles marshallii TaxID=1521116 RepID=UPI00237B141C|nr:unconventional myosin-IXa-like [Anopheles marshallii]
MHFIGLVRQNHPRQALSPRDASLSELLATMHDPKSTDSQCIKSSKLQTNQVELNAEQHTAAAASPSSSIVPAEAMKCGKAPPEKDISATCQEVDSALQAERKEKRRIARRSRLYYDDFVTLDTSIMLKVYVGALSLHYEALSVEASKQTTAEEIVSCIVERLGLTGNNYELAEVAGECKERRLSAHEKPVSVMLLWPMHSEKDFHRFYLREIQSDVPWLDSYGLDPQILRDFIPFLLQKENREYPDLCQLPDLNEATLLENLRQRFEAGHIYTYVGSILIAVNPFKFHPIYNPKYVRLYQNQRIGPILPPHIFAIADNAYYNMLKEKRNQCIVISGESGSGKTESTNFLLHHLTALSQKGAHGSGVEQTILSAGPVLEAFGNAKTAHNNNSSRFGKFIQVNYRENGMVQGAVVQKYLLEKSRIVSQGHYERNYHVFYYLLSGATDTERDALHLLPADKYHYLNAKNLTLENCDEKYEFSRLKQSMEMVGFSAEKQRRLFNVLSAVLLLGNVEFFPKKSTYHHDESVQVRNPDVVGLISELLRVKQETLMSALTSKRVKASGETLIMQYKLPEAIAARDALAKCLYGALFDWIVLQVNHALLNKDQVLHTGHSIGVLDIFGFEDFGPQNSFEQLCINYANEHLQYYFNLHVFKYEQKEYKREGIKWTDIEFLDNYGCLQLFESKPSGLLCILDDLCNFPGATNETLLQKFNSVHKDNAFYEKPQRKENAFIIKHYAGKVKYQVAEMREKNLDLMRQDIVSVLKNSSMAFVRELVGADPVAVFRWAILRAFFRGYFAFRSAGIKHRKDRADMSFNKLATKTRYRAPNDSIVSHLVTVSSVNLTINRIAKRISNAMSDITSGHSNNQSGSPGSNLSYHRQSLGNAGYGGGIGSSSPGGTAGTPRRSWSSFAFNNKNFPDGKLNYECHQQQDHAPQYQSKHQQSGSSSSLSSNYGGGGNGKSSTNTNASGAQVGGGGASGKGYGFGSAAARNRFERSGQDVMARASQIVMKNKSFRPRERPKKGLKNLQSVKTLSAGQNLSNQTSAIKTRKQPLTVTAQFQISLIALMETLNQANPFFIRCIKSNPNKIPNQFDDATVTRQLRYTGMLETVRIRRAGYNVRLTYEEFIQLYRILLPKGLVSSQKDVRDFMSTMDLNKQHYQLGLTKIYMRESQKIRLDISLHTKIIDSIICIQRWFRAILQRKKYCQYRTAACTIQSYWRDYLREKQEKFTRKIRNHAATVIQATWRGYTVRKWYGKLKTGVLIVQARLRGNQARSRFKELLSKKLQRERSKLRSTQSLPVEQPVGSTAAGGSYGGGGGSTYPEVVQAIEHRKKPIPVVGRSFETAIDIVNKNRALFADDSMSADFIDDDEDEDEEEEEEEETQSSRQATVTAVVGEEEDDDEDDEEGYEDLGLVDDPHYMANNRSALLQPVKAPAQSTTVNSALLDRNEKYIKSLAISGGAASSSAPSAANYSAPIGGSSSYQKSPLQRQEDVLDRPLRMYDIERASKSTFDDTELAKYRYERGGGVSSTVKLPVRRVDSGPSSVAGSGASSGSAIGRPGVQRFRYGDTASYGGSGMIRNQNHSNNSYSNSNVEIVFVNTGLDSVGAPAGTGGGAGSLSSSPAPRNLNRNSISSGTLTQTQVPSSLTASMRRDSLPVSHHSSLAASARTQGDEINSNYHMHQQQQQQQQQQSSSAVVPHHQQSQSTSSLVHSPHSLPLVSSGHIGNYQNLQFPPTSNYHQHHHHHQQSVYNNNAQPVGNTGVKMATSTPYSAGSNSSYSGASASASSQRVSAAYPDDFAQNYYTTTTATPKGKAAALLGTAKSEDSAVSNQAPKYPMGATLAKADSSDMVLSAGSKSAMNQSTASTANASSRRMKTTNLSEEQLVGGSSGSAVSYHPGTGLTRRGPVGSSNPSGSGNTSSSTSVGGDTLKRRNSDPTNKIPLLEVNRGNDMYQSSTRINIAGHQFRKVQRINKAERCACCQEIDSFVNEGYRCLDCKVLVHTKCIQNGGIKSLQCAAAKRSKRIRTGGGGGAGGGSGLGGSSKHDKHHPIGGGTASGQKISSTREYTDSTDKIISDAKELQLMQDFITQKICKMENDCEKPSEVDRVFKQALREFKDNLVAQYSVAHRQNSDVLNIKYRDLIANFEQVIETTSGRKNDFPLTMGVNAFRGFMNEFMNSRETEKPKTKRKKDKKRKHDDHTTFNGHTFQLTILNIATACEICQQFLLWPIERGLVCQNCKLTCHKKCYQKSASCNKIANADPNSLLGAGGSGSAVVAGGCGPDGQPLYGGGIPTKLFGVPLTALCGSNSDGVKIPAQITKLIMMIEMHGLYSEGIYRKSGVSSKIKDLKAKMDRAVTSADGGGGEMDFESYNVHVLTNVLKSFLREMPEPLLTFDRYDDFLRAADLSDGSDRVQTLLSLVKKIPPAHHCLFERLIFHLALVAKLEQYNRMSASSLAIVFAPCVLRTNRYVPAQDSLNDIGRQTKCMETLITQKMLNVKSTLADIDTLDTAAHTATARLSTLRSSKVFTHEEMANARGGSGLPTGGLLETETEEMLLEGHIQEIRKEKALLTSTLPSLARASSDDDLLSTDLDGEGGSLDDLSNSKEKDLDVSSSGGGGSGGGNMISDSGISIRYQAPSDHGGSSNVSLNNDVPMAVSYSLRDQSGAGGSGGSGGALAGVDYFHKMGSSSGVTSGAPGVKTKSLSHQTLLEREAFLRGSGSTSASSPQSPTAATSATASSTPSSSASAPSMIKSQQNGNGTIGSGAVGDRVGSSGCSGTGGGSAGGNGSGTVAPTANSAGKRADINLSHSMITLSTTSHSLGGSTTSSSSSSGVGGSTGSTGSGSDLQRQKPIIIRSVSGGYEVGHHHGSTSAVGSGTANPATNHRILIQGSPALPITAGAATITTTPSGSGATSTSASSSSINSTNLHAKDNNGMGKEGSGGGGLSSSSSASAKLVSRRMSGGTNKRSGGGGSAGGGSSSAAGGPGPPAGDDEPIMV